LASSLSALLKKPENTPIKLIEYILFIGRKKFQKDFIPDTIYVSLKYFACKIKQGYQSGTSETLKKKNSYDSVNDRF
jgi:hypothetical protein